MRNIISLRKTGGSVGFSLTKVLNSERLNWKKGDCFTFTVVDENEVVLRRVDFKKRHNKKEHEIQKA